MRGSIWSLMILMGIGLSAIAISLGAVLPVEMPTLPFKLIIKAITSPFVLKNSLTIAQSSSNALSESVESRWRISSELGLLIPPHLQSSMMHPATRILIKEDKDIPHSEQDIQSLYQQLQFHSPA